MKSFASLLRRFRRDERGAFAVVFAMMAIVLVAMSGAVVDFTSLQQSRTRAQVALDAAALALEPSIYTTSASDLQKAAQKLLVDRLADPATSWNDCSKTAYKAPCVYVQTPAVDTVNGQLTLQATLNVPMNFVSLVGVSNLSSQLTSVATRRKLSLEVAMALDNSGSMNDTIGQNSANGPPTRMDTLISAATCATNILFYGVSTCDASIAGKTKNDNVKIGIVPFTSAVNVGPSHAADFWIDHAGNYNISDDNFDDDDDDSTAFNGPVDRIALMQSMRNRNGSAMTWGGCVEARVNNGTTKQYDTDDTVPDINQPDTLFTPYFAPDEPSGFPNNYISDSPASCNRMGNCTDTLGVTTRYNDVTVIVTASGTKKTRSKWTGQVSSTNITTEFTTGPVQQNATTSSQQTNSMVTTDKGATKSGAGLCSCTGQTLLTTNTTTGTPGTAGWLSTHNDGSVTPPPDVVTTDSSGNTVTYHYTSASQETDTQPMKRIDSTVNTCRALYAPWGLSTLELQERMCKYNGAQLPNNVNQAYVYGPNGDCPFNPITPLSTDPATVTTAINAMTPQGATNIAEGAAWGFRVLSPDEPFTQGDAYDSATSKVLIVMTDGENTRYPANNMNDAQYYSPYGYPTNLRLGAATQSATDLQHRVNDRLSATCASAKAKGITVYTIGLQTNYTNEPSTNTTLLTNCASDPSDAFFPTNASTLQGTFVTIAQQLAALRLSR